MPSHFQTSKNKFIIIFLERIMTILDIFLKIPLFRKLIFIFADCFNLILSLLISNWFLKYNFDLIEIYSYTVPFCILLFIFTGQYKGLSRYVGSPDFYKISLRNLFLLIYQIFIYSHKLSPSLYRLLFLNYIVFTLLSGIFRFFLRDLLTKTYFIKMHY